MTVLNVEQTDDVNSFSKVEPTIRRLSVRHLAALYIKMQTMLKDEKGATMIEYALMVTFIAMAAFAAVVTFGTNLNAQFGIIAGLFP